MQMNKDEILQAAKQRAELNNLPYAGALTPGEAHQLIDTGYAVMVDVRTTAELSLVGRVPQATNVEWAFYPAMQANPNFAVELELVAHKNVPIVFMCRTGGRSHNAAVVAATLGYTAYNMLEGFEGESNEHGQRTLINGWKQAGLPWTNK